MCRFTINSFYFILITQLSQSQNQINQAIKIIYKHKNNQDLLNNSFTLTFPLDPKRPMHPQPTLQSTHSTQPQLPDIQQNLLQIFHSLQSSLYLLYLHYQPYVQMYEQYIKLGILFVLMYVFYKFGGMTVTDRVQSQKEELKSLIVKKNSVQEEVPKKISRIKANTNRILLLCVILAAVYGYAFYTGQYQALISDFQTPAIIVGSFAVFYIIYSNIERLILSKRLKQVSKLQENIQKKLNQFTSSLGSKVTSILKNHLCRELQLKFYSSKNINECQKQDCKDTRSLLKQKNDSIAGLVEETVDFEWCSVCKKRLPFDEHLHFEARAYNSIQGAQQNEAQEVKNKMGYLIDGLQRMRKWLVETSPCNCSKLYWTTSTRQIIEFKKTEKVIDSKIRQLQAHKHRNGLTR